MQIKAFFSSMKAANNAISKLKNAGFSSAALDMNNNDMYTDNRNTWTNMAGTETAPSLSALVMESDASAVDRSKAPAAAANPMVSGMGGFKEIADVSCNVLVDASDYDKERVTQILSNEGGSLKDPNLKEPRMKDTAETDVIIENSISDIKGTSDIDTNINP